TSQSSYWFGNSITVTASIENNGTGAFSGEIVASVFNSQGAFISDISAPQSISLNPNTYTTKIFTHAGGVPFIPGDYHVRVFYRTIGGLWTLVPHDYGILLDEINYAEFTVTYSSDIETNSAFTISNNGGKLIQGSSATVNVDIKNTGASTFYGSYKVCLLNLEGITQQDIQTLTDNNGLPSTYHYSNGVDFSGTITVDPGTYLLTLAYQPQGTGVWYYAGSSNYSNPVYVIVEAPAIPPDIYEVNDVFSQSHSLTASFSNNNATVSTTGATLHTGTDIDYYKIILPSGYNYTLTPRLHDAYNSGNGQTYTVDASFSYSVDGGNNWSETYDDIVYSNITINNGGTIYFKVAPYFTGNTGTYLLNVSISRTEIQSNNADLATLTVNPGTLTPAFNAGIFNYIVEEPYSVTSITINATAADANATIIGRGGFALNVGQNIFHVIVTAQDGVTQKDYTVIVTRANNTSIAESNISALQIYPNPASSQLKIKNYQLEDGENVEIVDVLGRVQQSTIVNQQSEIIIDVSHLAKGMYFIKIGNWRGKFVVN
ncbi:MAG: T9SS type A sorting domain-containing protein, partial [Bacteroidales bacterium]|nr:T9SS type A sorting domain-containing protein [Bacteroidales bacterium]